MGDDRHGNAAEFCRDSDELVLYKSDPDGKDAEGYITVGGWCFFHDQYDLGELSLETAVKNHNNFYPGFRPALMPVKNVDVPDYDDAIVRG